jgi:hypothetical protein
MNRVKTSERRLDKFKTLPPRPATRDGRALSNANREETGRKLLSPSAWIRNAVKNQFVDNDKKYMGSAKNLPASRVKGSPRVLSGASTPKAGIAP